MSNTPNTNSDMLQTLFQSFCQTPRQLCQLHNAL